MNNENNENEKALGALVATNKKYKPLALIHTHKINVNKIVFNNNCSA